MARTFSMHPERVASFEAHGWKAYYERKWLKMLSLLVRACHEEFHIPYPLALVAAYYTTRASLAWVPVNHDEQKVLAYLTKFYAIARRYSGLRYDVQRVATLELQYFDVHRRLSGKSDKEEFLQTLIALHSALFELTPEQARESAEWRLQAANTVDLISAGESTDIEADWRKLETSLQEAYRSVVREMK